MSDCTLYDFRIDYVVRDGNDPGSVIDGYQGFFFDTVSGIWAPWGAWNATSIALLKIAGHKFHTQVDGQYADVLVRWSNGEPFLITEADDAYSNNLGSLIWSRALSIAPPSDHFFKTPAYRAFRLRSVQSAPSPVVRALMGI